MPVNAMQLLMMGATEKELEAVKRLPLRVRWEPETGYSLDGIITARGLSAAQVLRYIAAVVQGRQ